MLLADEDELSCWYGRRRWYNVTCWQLPDIKACVAAKRNWTATFTQEILIYYRSGNDCRTRRREAVRPRIIWRDWTSVPPVPATDGRVQLHLSSIGLLELSGWSVCWSVSANSFISPHRRVSERQRVYYGLRAHRHASFYMWRALDDDRPTANDDCRDWVFPVAVTSHCAAATYQWCTTVTPMVCAPNVPHLLQLVNFPVEQLIHDNVPAVGVASMRRRLLELMGNGWLPIKNAHVV